MSIEENSAIVRRSGVETWNGRSPSMTALGRIARAIGETLEHERLWSFDTARRRRLDALDSLLLTMAGSLDVRDI